MAHGALGSGLSCLLELNVIYTAGDRAVLQLNLEKESARISMLMPLHVCACVRA